jgi:hypothetical protein
LDFLYHNEQKRVNGLVRLWLYYGLVIYYTCIHHNDESPRPISNPDNWLYHGLYYGLYYNTMFILNGLYYGLYNWLVSTKDPVKWASSESPNLCQKKVLKTPNSLTHSNRGSLFMT